MTDPTRFAAPFDDIQEKDVRVLIRMDDSRTVISAAPSLDAGIVVPLAGPDLLLTLLAESLAGEIVLSFAAGGLHEDAEIRSELESAAAAFRGESLRLGRGEDLRPLNRSLRAYAPPELAQYLTAAGRQ